MGLNFNLPKFALHSLQSPWCFDDTTVLHILTLKVTVQLRGSVSQRENPAEQERRRGGEENRRRRETRDPEGASVLSGTL